MDIYLFKFNNYYNRILKRFNTIDEYSNNGDLLYIEESINFFPNDGLQTSQVVNYEGSNPDYCILVDDGATISSRWFVLDSVRLVNGQCKLSLLRDVLAEWKDDIINAPCFIEKAMLSIDNPLIFNKENMTYNQIKTSETLLKDKSKCAWIVGYMDKNFSGTISVVPPNTQVDYILNSLDAYPYNQYTTSDFKAADGTTVFRFNWWDGVGNISSKKSYCFAWGDSGAAIRPLSPSDETGQFYSHYIYKKSSGTKEVGWRMLVGENSYNALVNKIVEPFAKDANTDWSSYSPFAYIPDLKTSDNLRQLKAERGKIIKVDTMYYKVDVTRVGTSTSIATVPQASTLGLKMGELADALKAHYKISSTEQPNEPVYEIETSHQDYRVSYIPVSLAQFTAEIPLDRLHSQHLPYDVFCIPYGDIYVGSSNTPTTKDYAMQFANEIIRAAGSNLYDIQLLPYCPVLDRIVEGSRPGDLPSVIVNSSNGDFYLSPSEGEAVSVGIWVNNPDFELTVYHEIEYPTTALEVKVMNECNLYRLVSPNYNGQFEFSAAKNRGVSEFRVDCSYKPFTPYIKISPLFDGLYGEDFDDARGLICSGDFSLTQISDPWVQYQINNKNYQVMFDREIKSIDITNDVQRERERWQIAGGALSAAGTLGMAGSSLGPYGAAAGVLLGSGISALAGMQDVRLSEQLRTEARDLRIDQFGYQLGNIKAMPTSLTKVSAINKNNKIFPFIEMYTCTELEKEALREKIKYNGMTVMAVGKIRDFIVNNQSYIKAQLIRLEEFQEDFHLLNAIANELNQGVFI